MSEAAVINPASVLPTPQAISEISHADLMAAWLAKMVELDPDYDVGMLQSDPGVIAAGAMGFLVDDEYHHVNDVYRALRLACATGADLVGLAADRGLARRVLVPATSTAPAVMEDYESLRYRAWLEMQRWSRGSSNLGVEGTAWKLAMPDASDIRVYDFPGKGRMRCVLLPRPGLDAAGQAAMVARVSSGLMRRSVRPGATDIDTVLAEVLTLDLSVMLGVLPGASRTDAQAASATAISAYMASRRQIGTRIALSRLNRAATVTNVVYAHFDGISVDLIPTRDQAYQLGNLTVSTELARD